MNLGREEALCWLRGVIVIDWQCCKVGYNGDPWSGWWLSVYTRGRIYRAVNLRLRACY